jgi:CRISPR-associated protein Cmr4
MSNQSASNNGPAVRAEVLFLFAESPVHAGAGSVRAAVDLPIQRSVHTGWPVLNDSTVRGGVRAWVAGLRGEDKANEWFGIEGPHVENPHAGRLSTADAELLLFPVAAPKGMTAWITCLAALRYFERKLALLEDLLTPQAAGRAAELRQALEPFPPDVAGNSACVTTDSALAWPVPGGAAKVVLESDSFTVAAPAADELARWFSQNAVPFGEYWRERLLDRFAVLPDEAFRHYVLRKTEIRTRIRIDEGRVAEGALWKEENLPMDSLLYTLVTAIGDYGAGDEAGTRRARGEVLAAFVAEMNLAARPVFQLGGDQNLGRGFLRLSRLGG